MRYGFRALLGALILVSAETPPRGRSPGVFAAPPGKTGALVLVGGGNLPDAVRRRFLELAGGKKARLVLIPSASAQPDAPAQSFAFWKTAPVASVRVLHTTRRRDADDPRFFGVLRDATGVWIAGGDQNRLVALFGGTGVERALKDLLRRGGVIGGTSAGASVPCDVMMTGEPKAGRGFGLLPGVTVDQHFSSRGRLSRLRALLHDHPGQFGIGIDESTAVVIRGRGVSVLGAATVTTARADGTVRVLRAGGHFSLSFSRLTAVTRGRKSPAGVGTIPGPRLVASR
jgi:cyanophycinase